MRGWTDDEATSAGRSDGFGWAFKKVRDDPKILERYVLGPSERRAIETRLSTLMHLVARERVERFGAKDSRKREEKVRLYVDAYVAAAMEQLEREAARAALPVK